MWETPATRAVPTDMIAALNQRIPPAWDIATDGLDRDMAMSEESARRDLGLDFGHGFELVASELLHLTLADGEIFLEGLRKPRGDRLDIVAIDTELPLPAIELGCVASDGGIAFITNFGEHAADDVLHPPSIARTLVTPRTLLEISVALFRSTARNIESHVECKRLHFSAVFSGRCSG